MQKKHAIRRTVLFAVFSSATILGPLCLLAGEPAAPAGKDGVALTAAQPDKEEKKGPEPEPELAPLGERRGGKPDPLASVQPGPGATDVVPIREGEPVTVDQAISNAAGVGAQRRSAVSFDPRVRGYHVGQLASYADGAFWTPARIDLDSALSKINPDYVRGINIIKGPYSVRYGPGFAFLDVESLPPERFKNGEFEAYGSSGLTYRSNGQGWIARQYVWGGNCDWGFRLGYNILAGNDYTMGNGEKLPTSYNSHNVDFAFGIDLSPQSSLEVKYLRVQQYDVEYPGLLTDINNLATDGVSVRYVAKDGRWFDRLTVDSWYNITSFNGDSARPGKRFQIPELDKILIPERNRAFLSENSQIRLDIDTQADLYTWGVREAMTWGEDKGVQLTIGADINIIRQQYDEFDSFNFSVPSNLGIPKSRMIDPGIFVDGALPLGHDVTVRVGSRVDFVSTELIHLGTSMDPATYLADPALAAAAFDTQQYFLWSAFATAEYKPNDIVTYSAGYGYAQRPPMLTELYTNGAFFGLIQNGLNAIYGNPTLDQEKIHQFDVGMTLGNAHTRARGGVSGFCAWVQDYITYQRLFINGSEFFTIEGVQADGQPLNLQTRLAQFRFINTSMARFIGGEAYGEFDLFPWLTPFSNVGYVDGRDLGRHEPLPGIVPLEARVGVRLHDPAKENPRWGLEFLSRIVNVQNLAAESLGERETAGFTVFDLRGFWQPRERLLFTAGVENMLDRFYREHLDLRTGRGVYQPGVNAYVGMRVSY